MTRSPDSTIRRIALLSVFLLTLGLGGPVHPAGLLAVDQTIFGMDCAPCAYGVEKSLRKLQGVTAVDVSLNEGRVTLRLAPDNEVTLAQIRRRILDNGFTPKQAQISASGLIEERASQLELKVAAQTRYRLVPASNAQSEWAKLQVLSRDAEVEVSGQVAEGMAEPLSISVTAVDLRR